MWPQSQYDDVDDDVDEETSLWNCVLLRDGCSISQLEDHHMKFFLATVLIVYIVFLLLILADIKYWWSMDKAQQQTVYFNVDNMKKKLRHVQTQQRYMKNLRSKSKQYLMDSPGHMSAYRSNPQDVGEGRFSVATVVDAAKSREIWNRLDEDSKIWGGGYGGEISVAKDEEYCVI